MSGHHPWPPPMKRDLRLKAEAARLGEQAAVDRGADATATPDADAEGSPDGDA